jgi:NSS family neurotransmitter:Na+ symporter
LSSLSVFDALDHLASNILLPLGGVALAVFGGWVVPPRLLAGQLGLSEAGNRALLFLLRYAVPLGIVAASILPILFDRR